MNARSAIDTVEIRLFLRATTISSPSLTRAERAARGRVLGAFDFISVSYNERISATSSLHKTFLYFFPPLIFSRLQLIQFAGKQRCQIKSRLLYLYGIHLAPERKFHPMQATLTYHCEPRCQSPWLCTFALPDSKERAQTLCHFALTQTCQMPAELSE